MNLVPSFTEATNTSFLPGRHAPIFAGLLPELAKLALLLFEGRCHHWTLKELNMHIQAWASNTHRSKMHRRKSVSLSLSLCPNLLVSAPQLAESGSHWETQFKAGFRAGLSQAGTKLTLDFHFPPNLSCNISQITPLRQRTLTTGGGATDYWGQKLLGRFSVSRSGF